jgi:Na+-translocating ferredoxin:NAD+ oxidoreductase RnfC subunit
VNAISRQLQALADCARSSGVVGAGGGGFSLADKLLALPYKTLIINAAQSEPLICKDWAALAHYGECVLSGAQLLIDTLGLGKAFLATRDEFSASLPDLPAMARKHKVILARLPDIYPLGYEKILKREILGIPMSPVSSASSSVTDSVLVVNAETLRNLSWAFHQQRPVCTKLITVAGEVAQPISLHVPIGTSFDDCLALAGGASCARYTVFHNGVLSGKPIDPTNAWVSATTLGYVLLPDTHSVVQAGNAMSARLAERRNDFLANTLAGRTQAMSAAYALFDLTSYRRARPAFRTLASGDAIPARVRITPFGHAREFQACVSTGEHVGRGQSVAVQKDSGGIALHASVHGVVEAADAQGITLRRSAQKEVHS